MHVPAPTLLRSLVTSLSAHFADDTAEASLGQSATAAVRLLEVRERGGAALVERRCHALADLLPQIAVLLPGERPTLDGLAQELRDLPADTRTQGLQTLLDRFETIVAEAAARPSLSSDDRAELLHLLADWEVADRRSLTDGAAVSSEADTTITAERFEAYLRDRFDDRTIRVTDFRPLAGGFGKSTILVTVAGTAIGGGLVIRRDPAVPTVDNDCHRVEIEFPVMRAAFERGFPAPEALWVDTQHRLLPGAHFLVMRMAPGRAGGNVFRSSGTLSTELLDVLARGAAHLHTLPPLTELGDLTNSIRSDIWDVSIGEATRHYVEGWRDLYLANAHSPSPTLMALIGWMLDNVPDADGRPVLVHGDVGFHNMLVDEGRLSALVDWEFAHVGDPAEDMGSICNAVGDAAWAELYPRYVAAGGSAIDPRRLHYFRVWQHVRNAQASNLSMGKFITGEITDLKLAYTGHYHFPLFIKAAWDLIQAGPEGAAVTIDY